MRFVAESLLWLTGLVMPVFIACGYGSPYKYSRRGQVIDAETRAGLKGIQVSCLLSGNVTHSTTRSQSDGSVDLEYDKPCESVRGDDTDGDAGGGLYQSTTVPFPAAGEFLLEMRH